jgi:thiol-disulfide isomerase/thioredoxin
LRRLAIVVFLIVALALAYRTFLDEGTGTGNLTLAAPEPNIGSSVNNFVARDTKGGTFKLTDDGIYVLTFWSTLNRNSNQARPQFIELAREYGDDASFAVVYVNGALKDRDAPYDRLHDPNGTLASRYNVKRVPRTFVIRDGEVSLVLDEFTLADYGEDFGRFLRQGIEDATEEQTKRDSQTALKDN